MMRKEVDMTEMTECVPTENIKKGLLVVYINGYGKNKSEYIGEFKGIRR